MARIRTIKPEFPQSESIGRVSRDARLLFVMLWPICDDHGRSRAACQLLAGMLFPYDADARELIDTWLGELEREGCIRRYDDGGSNYLEVTNWLKHQKIDKPSAPQFPLPSWSAREDSLKAREDSVLEGKGGERNGREGSAAPRKRGRNPLTPMPDDFAVSDRARTWAAEKGFGRLDEHFESFVGKARKQGYKYADWDAAFMEAVREDWAKLRVPSGESVARARVDL